MNDGQLHVDGNTPFLIARRGVVIPIAFVVEDGAGVRDVAWGNGGAGGEPQRSRDDKEGRNSGNVSVGSRNYAPPCGELFQRCIVGSGLHRGNGVI